MSSSVSGANALNRAPRDTPTMRTIVRRPRSSEPRVIEVIAASDNTFRVVNEKSAMIRAKQSEMLRLRITSQPGPEKARDRVAHGLVIRALGDQGWDLRLYYGDQGLRREGSGDPGSVPGGMHRRVWPRAR
jgi:hypothetical protein